MRTVGGLWQLIGYGSLDLQCSEQQKTNDTKKSEPKTSDLMPAIQSRAENPPSRIPPTIGNQKLAKSIRFLVIIAKALLPGIDFRSPKAPNRGSRLRAHLRVQAIQCAFVLSAALKLIKNFCLIRFLKQSALMLDGLPAASRCLDCPLSRGKRYPVTLRSCLDARDSFACLYSTTDQDLGIQVSGLKAAGCEVIRSEKMSGTTTEGREELKTVLDFLRAGDVLVVTRIDRLARSVADLQDIVRTLRAKGAALAATEQQIDTTTAAGKCFLDMLAVFAEFETNLRRERQLEGIRKAKAEGRYRGRPATLDTAQIEKLKAEGLGASAIAKRLNIARSSVYRVVGEG
jgi:DNA invertase Pin-like site-specific DNA recombinase